MCTKPYNHCKKREGRKSKPVEMKLVRLLESRNRRVDKRAVSGIKGGIREIDNCVDRQ